jgi:ParB family chromosome partitioning protein
VTKARQLQKERAEARAREMQQRLLGLQQQAVAQPSADDAAERTSAPVAIGDTRDSADLATHMVTQALDITLIDPDPDQPRRFPAPFSPGDPGRGVEELAASIQERGLLQPILVQRHLGRYRVLVGERRWRAFRLLASQQPATWTHIPAIDWAGPITPQILLAMRIIENDHREAPDPEHRRAAYVQLRTYCAGNASEASRMLGISRATFYRVTGESDPDGDAPAPRPKAASRLSFGQLTRALGTFEADRLQKLNPKQTDELEALLDRMLTLIRHRRAATEATRPPTG